MNITQAASILAILFDAGFSSFYYLETLKHYYLSEISAMTARGEIYEVKSKDENIEKPNELLAQAQKNTPAENMAIAQRAFETAENMATHTFPLSFVSRLIFTSSAVSADIHEIRSNVLWELGKKGHSLQEARSALEKRPKHLGVELRVVRLLAESGQQNKALEELSKMIEEHPSSLIHRLYFLALKNETSPGHLQKFYYEQLDECYANTFGIEPSWPPLFGDRYFREHFYSRDIKFIFDRLLSLKSEPPSKRKATD